MTLRKDEEEEVRMLYSKNNKIMINFCCQEGSKYCEVCDFDGGCGSCQGYVEAKGVLNLTQHPATSEQLEVDVIDLQGEEKEEVKRLLTFEEAPSSSEMKKRAEALAEIARASALGAAMVGGAPYFMPFLETALKERGVLPLYSFSKRESVENTSPSGEVVKTTKFKHVGWVEASI